MASHRVETVEGRKAEAKAFAEWLEQQPAQRETVQEAMTKYLQGFEWQVFATLTFAPRKRKVFDGFTESGQAKWKSVRSTCAARCPGRGEDGRCLTHEAGPQTVIDFTQRVAKRFWAKLNERYYGKRWYRRDQAVRLFLPWETQKWGALHAHPLIGKLPMTGQQRLYGRKDGGWRFQDLHAAWRAAQLDFGLHPGHAHLLPYESGGASAYVAKYCAKDVAGDQWSLFGF